MTMKLVRKGVALLAVMLAFAGARPVSAQTTLSAQRSLAFGQLVPGTPTRVAPSDVTRRAEFLIEGNSSVTVQLVLPTVMTNAGGATIPMVFGAADAILKEKNKNTTVDPRSTIQVKLNNGSPTAELYLGGTVQPIAGQVAGSYQATVVLMVVGGG